MARKILFVSRDCLLKPTSGGSTYALDILRHLDSEKFSIDLILLTPSRLQWGAVLPGFLPDSTIRIHCPSFLGFGRWLVNPIALALLPARYLLSQILVHRLHPRISLICQCILRAMRSISFPSWPGEGKNYFEADPTAGELSFIRSIARKAHPDALMVNYICLTPVLDILPQGSPIKKIVLAHDLWHRRAAKLRSAGLEPDLKEWTKQEEIDRYSTADKVIGISLEERSIFAEMLGFEKIMTLPKAIRLENTREVPDELRCLFVGTDMPSNLDGIEWFMKEVWPHVTDTHAGASLHVCGTICRKITNPPDHVVLHGLVDDLAEEYRKCNLVIVPLRTGSGVKIKLTEAVSYQRCCVSTSCGIEGLPATSQSGVLVADDPVEFSHHINRLLSDAKLRTECIGKMRNWASTHLGAEVAYHELCSYLNPRENHCPR